MNKAEAFCILRHYLDKRLDLDFRPLQSIGLTDSMITEALALVLESNGYGEPANNCTDCRYANITFGYCRLEDGHVKPAKSDDLKCRSAGKYKAQK